MKKFITSIILVAMFVWTQQAFCGNTWLPWAGEKLLFDDPGPIGETTPDTVRYKTININITDDANLTAAQCCNTLITNYGWNATAGDLTLKLPAAESGLDFLFVNKVTDGSADIYFDTFSDTNQFILMSTANGTACGDGNRTWTDNATIYESARFYTLPVNATAYDWVLEPKVGTFANKGS